MNLYLPLRAILVSVLVYVISFVFGALGGAALGISMEDPTVIPPEMWYIGAFTAVIAVAGGSWFYFSSRKIQPSPLGGLAFAITSILVGFVLDAVMMGLVAIGNNQPGELLSMLFAYYIQPMFWLTLLLIVVVCVVVGHQMGRGSLGH